MTLKPYEEEQIREWNDKLAQEVIVRVRLTDDERSGDFDEFCDLLSRQASGVRFLKEKAGEEEEEKYPAFQINENWTYYAVPRGTELIPFLEICSMPEEKELPIQKAVQEQIKEMDWPGHFKIYVSPQCPFCPQAVRQMAPLPLLNRFIQIDIIDGTLFPEMSAEDHIQAVPTVILDDYFRWTGSLHLTEILDVLLQRDPAQFEARTYENMLKQGAALRLAKMMIERNQVFPAFLELIIHPQWSVRLGAMVVMDEITEHDATLTREAVKSLWPRLEELENPIKGDLIYLCGESGAQEFIPALESFLTESYGDELWEVTLEALEKLREASPGQ